MPWFKKLQAHFQNALSKKRKQLPSLKSHDIETDPDALIFFEQFCHGKPEQLALYQRRSELELPSLLNEMIQTGRWRHPGDAIIRSKIPFIQEPVAFLNFKGHMLSESGPLMSKHESENETFSEYRGSVHGLRDLPWIDVEKTIFIVINKIPGDDLGIALDFRLDLKNPRVVGGDWHTGNGLEYREISRSFEAFVELLGL